MSNDALSGREGLETDRDPNHPLTRALRDLVRANKLSGAVLLSFTGDRVGINSSSPSPDFARVVERLANEILAAFADGGFDACLGDDPGMPS